MCNVHGERDTNGKVHLFVPNSSCFVIHIIIIIRRAVRCIVCCSALFSFSFSSSSSSFYSANANANVWANNMRSTATAQQWAELHSRAHLSYSNGTHSHLGSDAFALFFNMQIIIHFIQHINKRLSFLNVRVREDPVCVCLLSLFSY